MDQGRGSEQLSTNDPPAPVGGRAPTAHVHAGVALRDKAALVQRLNRIEGQVRGIRRMIDEDRYCPEVLTQIAAVRAALDRVGLLLLEDHTRGCLVEAVREGSSDAAITELVQVLKQFIL